MAKFKRLGDPNKVVDEQWFEYGLAAVVAEEYEDGGVQFFVVNHYGNKLPFTNIKSLNEEGSVVTKEEAMEHLEKMRKRFLGDAASASPPE